MKGDDGMKEMIWIMNIWAIEHQEVFVSIAIVLWAAMSVTLVVGGYNLGRLIYLYFKGR